MTDPKNIPERLNCGSMKLGRCYAADVIEMNPYEEIKPYRGPMLIVRGTKDNIVNPDCSRQAQYSYSNAKLAVRMDLAKVQRNRHRTLRGCLS